MKKIYTSCLFLMAVMFLPVSSMGQNNKDFMIWSGFQLEKKIAPETSVELRQEVRLQNNASQVQKAFVEIGIEHQFNKHIEVSMAYRNSQNVQRDYSFSSRHRLATDLSLENEWKPVEISYRIRHQMNYKDILSSEDGRVPQQFIRHKLKAKLDLNSRWAPYASTEFFHALNNLPDLIWLQNRVRIGTEYEITRNNSISVFYMLRNEYVNIPSRDYILGFRVKIDL